MHLGWWAWSWTYCRRWYAENSCLTVYSWAKWLQAQATHSFRGTTCWFCASFVSENGSLLHTHFTTSQTLRNPCMDFWSRTLQVIEALCQPLLKSTHILLNTRIKTGRKGREGEGKQEGRVRYLYEGPRCLLRQFSRRWVFFKLHMEQKMWNSVLL